MSTASYPHKYDDCDGCQRYDADLRVNLDNDDDAARWCRHCAGELLVTLTNAGIVATVRSLVRAVEPDDDAAQIAHDPGWTVDLAFEVLTKAKPPASKLVQALVDEGGRATAAQLKNLVGTESLGPLNRTLNTAARHLWRGERLKARLQVATPLRDPDRPSQDIVHSYELAAGTVEIWGRALRRLDR